MKKIILILLTFHIVGCSSTKNERDSSHGDHLFYDVNLITMENDQVIAHQAVGIKDGKITLIEPIANVDTSRFENIIPGSGKYLLPGLAEMHAHIPPPGTNDRTEDILLLYLSNGITTIRGMLGHPYHLELKELVTEGNILGPRIYTSGPSLNGNSVQSTAAATKMVVDQKKEGYDFLKLHPGLQLEVFNEIVRTADSVGIDFAGHVSVDVGIVRALEAGYASIDHVDGYLEGLVPASENVDPNANGFFGYNFAPLADTNLIPKLIQLTKENQVWVVTTQSLFTRWASPEPADTYLSEPSMKYMPPSTLEAWKESKNNLIAGDNYSTDQWETMLNIRKKIIHDLNLETDLLLLGSDAPQVFNVPGFSIHHEIQSLIDCGLTPYDVLKAGTINPAKFFKQTKTFGAVATGLVADLLLVNANPLIDIKNLQHPSGVMVRGEWLDREFIDQELARIAAKFDD